MAAYEAKVQMNRTTSSRNPARPAYIDAFDSNGANPTRFMCVLRLPWLDRSRDKFEWGLNCSLGVAINFTIKQMES